MFSTIEVPLTEMLSLNKRLPLTTLLITSLHVVLTINLLEEKLIFQTDCPVDLKYTCDTSQASGKLEFKRVCRQVEMKTDTRACYVHCCTSSASSIMWYFQPVKGVSELMEQGPYYKMFNRNQTVLLLFPGKHLDGLIRCKATNGTAVIENSIRTRYIDCHNNSRPNIEVSRTQWKVSLEDKTRMYFQVSFGCKASNLKFDVNYIKGSHHVNASSHYNISLYQSNSVSNWRRFSGFLDVNGVRKEDDGVIFQLRAEAVYSGKSEITIQNLTLNIYNDNVSNNIYLNVFIGAVIVLFMVPAGIAVCIMYRKHVLTKLRVTFFFKAKQDHFIFNMTEDDHVARSLYYRFKGFNPSINVDVATECGYGKGVKSAIDEIMKDSKEKQFWIVIPNKEPFGSCCHDPAFEEINEDLTQFQNNFKSILDNVPPENITILQTGTTNKEFFLKKHSKFLKTIHIQSDISNENIKDLTKRLPKPICPSSRICKTVISEREKTTLNARKQTRLKVDIEGTVKCRRSVSFESDNNISSPKTSTTLLESDIFPKG